jgi:pilus assembly protein CpaC
MTQQYPHKPTGLQSASTLLALILLAISLPVVATAQEDPRLCGIRRPLGARPDLRSLPSTTVVHPTADADAKVNALIAEVMEPEAQMELSVHRSKLIRTKVPVSRVSITEPKTVEIVQFSPTEFELLGLQVGETTVTFWFGDNQALRYLVRVAPDTATAERATKEYHDLQNKINEVFPNSMVQLIPIADKLIVRGQARDSAEASQILALLSSGRSGAAYGQGADGGVVHAGRAVSPNPGVNDLPTHNIINLLDTPGEQQVMLKVRIAQLDRTAARRMATELQINSGILALNTGSGGLSAVFSSVLNPEDLRLALTAVSSTGYTKILAEPNLVALNGQSASFHAGGSFAVPTAVGIGGVSGINTQFQRFGTQLTFTPTIIDKDRIRLTVRPSSSAINRSLTVQGIPGTSERSVDTTVDMRVGQWMAIAGLLEDSQQGSKIRVPFIGDIPILGTAFGQNSVSRSETELLVLVSPELVHPMDARETPLVLPGMEIGEPGDTALFLGGSYVAQYDKVRRAAPSCAAPCPSQAPAAEARRQAVRETMSRPEYQRSEKYYIYGQHGTSE